MTAVEMGSEDDPTEAKRLQEMRKGWSLPRDHALDLAATGWAGISRGTHITHPSELSVLFRQEISPMLSRSKYIDIHSFPSPGLSL